jgi:hypothetical protein
MTNLPTWALRLHAWWHGRPWRGRISYLADLPIYREAERVVPGCCPVRQDVFYCRRPVGHTGSHAPETIGPILIAPWD